MIRKSYRAVAALAAGLLLSSAAGCATTHADRKIKAEQHWGQVRGRIKVQMASQQLERGLVDEAVEYLSEALKWDPDNAEANRLLALCRLEQGRMSAAQRASERAAALAPDDAGIASVRGMVAERRGRYEEALGYYRQARGLDDADVQYLVSEVECLVALDRSEEARRLLEAHLVDYDNDPSLHALLGEIALREGRNDSAAYAFRSVLTAGRYDPVIAEEYALLATRLGQYRDALTVLEPLIRERDGDVPGSVRRAAAQSMFALHQYDDARRMLTALLGADPNDGQAWHLLAKLAIATGDSATLCRCATNLRRLAPTDPQTLLIAGYAAIEIGRLAEAEATLREALALDENDVLAHCLLGLTAERARDLATARRHYRQALRIDPSCRWAEEALRAMGEALEQFGGDALSEKPADGAAAETPVAWGKATDAD